MEPTSEAVTRRTDSPLYDARFEHDACGVGFVADAGGRSRDRVLPLALAGLAPWVIAARSGPTANRATGPASPCRSTGRSWSSWPATMPSPGPGSSRSSCPAGAPPSDVPGPSSKSALRRGRPDRPGAGASCPSTSRRARRLRGRARARRSPRRSSPARHAAPTIPDRSRTTPSSAAWSSPVAASRPPPGRPVTRWPSCPSRRPRRGRSSTRASSPAGACPTSSRTCGRR